MSYTTINLFDIIGKEKLDKIIIDAGLFPADIPARINFAAIEKKEFKLAEISRIIDHTALRAETTSDMIRNLCNEAAQYKFASVCVNPSYIPLCKKILENSSVKVCTVIGFPLGANDTSVKKFETEQAINNGADEVDMVINIGKLKDGDYNYIYNDILAVVETAKLENKITKVIIETCYLSLEEKIQACLLSAKAGADFVKTSTGFGPSGATAADVALMKYISGNKMKVKAAGGIRSKEDAFIMMSCGADRLGTSSGVKIMNEK